MTKTSRRIFISEMKKYSGMEKCQFISNVNLLAQREPTKTAKAYLSICSIKCLAFSLSRHFVCILFRIFLALHATFSISEFYSWLPWESFEKKSNATREGDRAQRKC